MWGVGGLFCPLMNYGGGVGVLWRLEGREAGMDEGCGDGKRWRW